MASSLLIRARWARFQSDHALYHTVPKVTGSRIHFQTLADTNPLTSVTVP